LILYGKDYINALNSVKIIVWSSVFAIIGTARGIWIICEQKNKYVKRYLFWGAVVNFVLNYFFIPEYGITGAAVATLIAQITSSLIAPLFFKETRIHTKLVLSSFFYKL